MNSVDVVRRGIEGSTQTMRLMRKSPKEGGLLSDLDRRLIVAAEDGAHKIDSAVLNKPQG